MNEEQKDQGLRQEVVTNVNPLKVSKIVKNRTFVEIERLRKIKRLNQNGKELTKIKFFALSLHHSSRAAQIRPEG